MNIQGKTSSKKPNALVVGMSALCSAGFDRYEILNQVTQGISSVNQEGLAPIELDKWGRDEQKLDIPALFQTSRCLPWFYLTIQKALQETQWTDYDYEKLGVIFASTTASVDQWQSQLPFLHSKTELETQLSFDEKMTSLVKSQSLSQPLDKITQYFGWKGPRSVVSSSCSASLQALALGALWIESQFVDRCIIITTEVLCPLTVLGFDSIRLLAKNICKPFDKNRNGINLGEAAAVICLESSAQIAPNQKIGGRISGVGMSTDAYHTTSPHPEGKGSARAIKMSLERAQLQPDEIDWIYAHGTASLGNDLAEFNAFKAVFPVIPPVVSTKPIHGHTLAASGLLESVIGLTALEQNKVLKNHFTTTWDPAFNLSSESIFREPEGASVRHILKNSLGFGGINVSVVLSRA